MEPEEEQKPTNLPEESILDELINQAVKEGAIINLADTNVPSDHIIEAKVILEPCPVPVSVAIADNQSAPSEPEGTLNVLETPIHPEHQRIQEYLAQRPPLRESVQLKKESILTTEKPYLTHVGESVSQPEIQTNEAQVEVKSIKLLDWKGHQSFIIHASFQVPRWVIKPLSARTATHGIETLDDEVFTKRHLKHEMDEKRRKRYSILLPNNIEICLLTPLIP